MIEQLFATLPPLRNGAEQLALEIDGQPHPGLLSIEFSFGATDALHRVVAGVREIPGALTKKGSEAILKSLRPDGSAEVLVTGRVRRSYGDVAKPALRRFLEIESKACDAVECAADGRKHGYRLKGKTLGDAAKTLFRDYGVPVKVETESRSMDLDWAPGDRAFGVVESHARKAGLLYTATPDGGVAQFKGIRGRHAGRFVLGGEEANATTLQFEDSERGQFSHTHVFGQRYKGGKGKDETDGYAIAENEAIRRLRIDIRRIEQDGDAEDLKTRAEWDNRRGAGGDNGNGTQIVVATRDWRDDDGTLWTAGFARYVSAWEFELEQDMALKSGTLSWSKDAQLARLTFVDPRTLGGKDAKGKSGKSWSAPSSKAKYEELE
ncbi:hypothetical protein [Bosea sp. (in: a-proteobacteria)]|uniref:hypothetical protein n=1 Tax=Bosea sp. (in: a-proteobacteria) TaxID=1871050 RepID=UPI003B3ACB95